MNSDQLYEALEACKATSSKKGKLEIVKTLGAAQHWLKAALDPTIAYFVAKLPKYERHGDQQLGAEDDLLLARLANRTYTGNDALQRIADTMRELTPASQEVLRRILLKDLRCGVGETIVNTAFPGLIPVFPYQRCVLEKDSNMGKWNWDGGIIVQLKADGMFANVNVTIDGAKVFSRQGSPFPAGSLGLLDHHLWGTFDNGSQTHGELLVYDADGMLLDRAVGNGILNSLLQGGELPKGMEVRYFAWDQIPIDCAVDKGSFKVPYEMRLTSLRNQIAEAALMGGSDGRSVQLIPTHTATSREQAVRIYKGYLAEELEGAVCKHPKAIWRDGDNKDQVKLKQEEPVDLEVEEILPGDEGKRTEGRPGRVRCKTSCGRLKVNVTVKNEKMRDALESNPEGFIGKIMVVVANGITPPTENNPDYSLFLPRFREDTPRLDKTEADSLELVRDQFEAAVAA